MDEKTNEAINRCKDLALINETALRNFNIRNEFLELRARGYRSVEIIKYLMRKYNLSWSRMNTITYDYTNDIKRRRRIKESKEYISQD